MMRASFGRGVLMNSAPTAPCDHGPVGHPNQLRLSLITSTSSIDSITSDEYHFAEETHPRCLLDSIETFKNTRQFCDVIICVENVEIACHRLVLASFSPYFRAMFTGDLAESKLDKVTINGVEASMINLLVNFAYTSEVTITKLNVQSLLSAANLLGVETVKHACCRFMKHNMDESNCIGILCFSEQMSCSDLNKCSMQYCFENFTAVSQQDEFLGLDHEKLIQLISNDDVEVDSEEYVYAAVIKWLEHNSDERRQYFDDVMTSVRLPLMSPYFLHDCVEKHWSVKQSPKCRQLLDEAKNYHLLPDRRAQMQSARTRPRKHSSSLEVIIAVGGEDDKVVLRSTEFYEPRSNTWTPLACLPFAVSKHGLGAAGNAYVYMAGGEFPDGSASERFWRFDPLFDSWQQLEDMTVPRSELGLAVVDGNIYAVGGWEGASRLDSVEFYNPEERVWKFTEPMAIALTSPAVVAHEGLLFVTGGAVLEDGDGINKVQCYNPRTGKWKTMAPMLIPRSGSAACVLNGFIYVLGGWHASTENTNKVERYSLRTNEWQSVAPMNERRYRPGVAVIDNKIYVLGGEEGFDKYHDTVECYDEETGSWTIVSEMQTSRSWLSCVGFRLKKAFNV